MSLTTVHSYIIIFLWTSLLSHVKGDITQCGSNSIPQPNGLELFYSEETDTLGAPQYCECFPGGLPNGHFGGTTLQARVTINAQRANINANSDIVFAIGRDDLYFGGILRSDDDGVTLKNKKANLALTPKPNESLISKDSLIQTIIDASNIDPEGNSERDPRRYLTQTGSTQYKPLFERRNENDFGLYELNNTGIDFSITIFSDKLSNLTEVIFAKGGASYSIIYQGSFNNEDCLTVILDTDISPLEQTIINYVTVVDLSDSILNPTDPCDGINTNALFIIDESGSVGASNFEKSVLYIRDVVRDIVTPTSIVSGIAFGSTHDFIYEFSDTQIPRATTVIPEFEDEALDFDGGTTNTAGALREAVIQFQSVGNGFENVIVLVTDGQPCCSFDRNPCHPSNAQLINDIQSLGITILIIGVGEFDVNVLNCLVTGPENVETIADFTQIQFENTTQRLREILCAPTQLSPAKQHLFNHKYNNNNNDNKFITLTPKTIFGFEMGLVIGFIILSTLLIISIIIGIYNCRTKNNLTLKYESVSTDTVA